MESPLSHGVVGIARKIGEMWHRMTRIPSQRGLWLGASVPSVIREYIAVSVSKGGAFSRSATCPEGKLTNCDKLDNRNSFREREVYDRIMGDSNLNP